MDGTKLYTTYVFCAFFKGFLLLTKMPIIIGYLVAYWFPQRELCLSEVKNLQRTVRIAGPLAIAVVTVLHV